MNPATTETEVTTERPAKDRPKDRDPFQEAFDRFEARQAGCEPSWVLPIRKAGLARFAERGFPTLRDEDWRFTNIEPIAKLPFRPILEASPVGDLALDTFPFAGLDCLRLVFVNGHHVPSLSAAGKSERGLTVTSLAEALAGNHPLLEKHLGRDAGLDDNPFAALQNAFFTDGALIHAEDGAVVERPIHILNITTAAEKGSAMHPRHLIVAGQGSRLTILESHVAMSKAAYFSNVVTEMVVGEEAVVEHCKFQDEASAAFHVSSLHARLGRASRFWHHSIATGARLSRHNIRTRLEGEHLECVLNGLYLTRGEQVADHHMIVNHASPHCASHEYFNGILADKSRGVFHGRILVQPEAQKTDAKQTNKNLLLSDEATANTKPQLEIYADDVKCTHGATIGQLNDESIFYLRTRGIGAETARRMLIHAFAGEIIERIQSPAIREEMDQLVWNRLEEHEQIAVDK